MAARRRSRAEHPEEEREQQLAARRQSYAEHPEEQQLAARRQSYAEHSEEQRLAARRQSYAEQTEQERSQRLAAQRHRYAVQRHHTTHSTSEVVNNCMNKFQKQIDKWNHKQCIFCLERWPVRMQHDSGCNYTCLRCKRDKHVPKLFSAQNNKDPGPVPPELEGMTQVEEMLIARACPIMSVFRKHGGQRAFRGHVLNLPQSINDLIIHIPVSVDKLPVLQVIRTGADNTQAQFRVRRSKVVNALLWLKLNNIFYRDIEIDHIQVAALPEDGIPDGIPQCHSDSDAPDEEGPPSEIDQCDPIQTTSFLPKPQEIQREESAIRAAIASSDPLQWPQLGQQGLNEFTTQGLATQVFPTLFPYGLGDPTATDRQYAVSLSDSFKHLMRYSDMSPNATFRWRFASHPRFPFWAMNMKQRHQLISQSKIFMQRNPNDANLTIEQLRDMVGRMDSTHLINRLQRYASKVQGTRQYWYSRCEDLTALIEQKGSPTVFWTLSSADNYWPQLHSLMPHTTTLGHASRVASVIDNPHLTDWFFHSKLTDFIKYWLQDSLNSEWHWYRYEYQARGSTHAHGCAKLKDDPGLTKLVSAATVGWVEQQNQENTSDEVEISPNQNIIEYGNHAKQLVV